MSIPFITGVVNAVSEIRSGDYLQVDARKGLANVNPTSGSWKNFGSIVSFDRDLDEVEWLERLLTA